MLNRLFITLIRGYQKFISPLLVPSCRFHPSCSEYAACALGRFALPKAVGLILVRLFKCHPYHPGGFDPIK